MPCRDHYADEIRKTYRADVVAAPSTGLTPLTVLLKLGNTVEVRGSLAGHLVPNPDDPFSPPEVQTASVASLSGKTSSQLDVDLGLKLLGPFLTALAGGVPLPTVELSSKLWSGASKLTFETLSVEERSIDIGALGAALRGRELDRGNPAVSVFWDAAAAEMLVLTRTLMSGKVSVVAHRENGQDIKLDVDGLADVLGDSSAKLGWEKVSDTKIVFSGENPATFAASNVEFFYDADGDIKVGPSRTDVRLLRPEDPVETPILPEGGIVEFAVPATGRAH